MTGLRTNITDEPNSTAINSRTGRAICTRPNGRDGASAGIVAHLISLASVLTNTH
jgi:hypothetical protein